MKCSQCFWHNPDGALQCVMCRTALLAGETASTFQAVTPAAAPAVPIFLATDLSRTMATLIDGLQMLVSAGLWLVVMWDISISFWLKATGALALLYAPAILDAAGGSIGKRCFKIQIVTTQGARPSLILSLWRHSVKYVLHLLLPVVWKLIEGRLTGGRYFHDALASTVVIERFPSGNAGSNAPPELFHEALIQQMKGAGESRPVQLNRADLERASQQTTKASQVFDALKNVLAYGIGIAMVLLFAQAGWSLYKESRNPMTAAISDAKDAGKQLTTVLTQRFERGEDLELNWSDPSLTALEAEMGLVFSSVTIEPSGLVALQIKVGEAAGKHIVLAPEFSFSKKSIKKWKCGSPDVEDALLPTGCKTAIELLTPSK